MHSDYNASITVAKARAATGAALAIAGVSLSSAALAHPGHDHAHWASPAMHSALFLSVAAVVAVAIWFSVRRRRRGEAQRVKQRQD